MTIAYTLDDGDYFTSDSSYLYIWDVVLSVVKELGSPAVVLAMEGV